MPSSSEPQWDLVTLLGDDNPRQPWERQAEEPMLWYSRFDLFYRPLGPSRSLLSAYNMYRVQEKEMDPTNTVSQSWENNAKRFRWQVRAEMWDDLQLQLARQDEQEVITQWRESRRQFLRAFFGKAVQALERYNPAEEEAPTLGQLTNAFNIIMQQIRSEFEAPPVSKSIHLQVTARERMLKRAEQKTDSETDQLETLSDEQWKNELENALAVLEQMGALPGSPVPPPPNILPESLLEQDDSIIDGEYSVTTN